jgi:chemotaxis protein CheC
MTQRAPHRPKTAGRGLISQASPLGRAIVEAADAVAAALSNLSGVEVKAHDARVCVLPIGELANIGGCPGDDVVALFHTYGGTDNGQIMLIFDVDQARILADQMLWNPPGTTTDLDAMALSALAESSNILGSHFLTAIADMSGAQLAISTPEPLIDFRGAALSIPAAAVAKRGDTFMSIQSDFRGRAGTAIGATLLVVPENGFDSTVIWGLA